jgi:hypothetical protein
MHETRVADDGPLDEVSIDEDLALAEERRSAESRIEVATVRVVRRGHHKVMPERVDRRRVRRGVEREIPLAEMIPQKEAILGEPRKRKKKYIG